MAWTEQDLREIEDELKKVHKVLAMCRKRKVWTVSHLCPHIKK